MHCLIIDEHPDTTAPLRALAEARGYRVHTPLHPYEIRGLLKRHPVDLFCINARLWDYRLLKGMDQPPPVIFISSLLDKLKESLDTQVPFHLKEPFGAGALDRVLFKIAHRQTGFDTDFFFIKHTWQYRRIDFDDIELVCRSKHHNYVIVHTVEKKYEIAGTLSALESQLPTERFIRVSDELILHKRNLGLVKDNVFSHKEHLIPLTYRYIRSTAYRRKQEYPV